MSNPTYPWKRTWTVLPNDGQSVWIRMQPAEWPSAAATFDLASGTFTFTLSNSTGSELLSCSVIAHLVHSWRDVAV